MKRNILYLTLLAAGLLVSCSKDDGPVEPEGPVDATITLSVFSGTQPSGTRAATKADESDGQVVGNEARINNLQVSIFKLDGSLLASHYEDYSADFTGMRDTIGVSAKSGRYILVVLANAGNVTYTTLSELKGKTTELSTQSRDNLTMSSKCITIDIKAGENYIGPKNGFGTKVMTGNPISEEKIKVTRIVGRIDLESLEVDWSEDTSADLMKEGAGFKLKKIYIRAAKKESRVISGSETTAVGTADWELVEWTGVPVLHGNRGEESNYLSALDLFHSEEGTNIEYESSKTFDPLSCYVMENGNDNTDVPDPTRIIIVGDITDSQGNPILSNRYYTIIVNDKDGNSQITGGGIDKFSYIRRNYVYHVYATITGKGSPEEERYNNASITSLVQSVPWQVKYEKHPDVN